MLRPVFLLFVIAFFARPQAAMLVPQEDLKLRVAEGFKVSLFAKAKASCIAIDASGRTLVATGGMISDVSGAPLLKISENVSAFFFDGKDLIVGTSRGVFRYKDSIGPAEKSADIPNVRAIRIGPEGALYFVTEHAVHCGSKTIATGFKSLRGFDFNSAGDIFLCDGDFERDFFLPWYVPTRLYHVAPGQDHGWQEQSIKPEHFADTVEILTPIGRTSPGGIAVYRHTMFPDEYRDGIFLCDEEGKIFFCKLQKQGSTYRPRLDLLLEGDLAPQQILVAPDGALLVLTRDSILRIEHSGERGQSLSVLTKAQELLQAPQPLEAWSRAKWIPQAKQLGGSAFRDAINDSSLSDAERLRAVEIYTELFGVLKDEAGLKSPAVRARVGWAMAKKYEESAATPLRRLAQDTDLNVRRCALESILIFEPALNPATLVPILRQNLDHSDKRVRQTAARICSRLPIPEWDKLWDADAAYSVQTELSLLLAATWRNPALREEVFWRTLETFPLIRDNSTRSQAMRLLELSLGDYSLPRYEPLQPIPAEFATNALPAIRKIFGTGDTLTSMEAARLLALLEDDSAETVEILARQFDLLNSPTRTFHYLLVLARLRGAWPESLAPKVAEFIKTFESALPERERRPDQNWKERLREITDALVQKNPKLAELL